MQIPIIRDLVNRYSIAELTEAETAILSEMPCPLTQAGADEGEQLTHILAAIHIKERMAKEPDLEISAAIRDYTKRVRESIN